jgi:hypothetical protein
MCQGETRTEEIEDVKEANLEAACQNLSESVSIMLFVEAEFVCSGKVITVRRCSLASFEREETVNEMRTIGSIRSALLHTGSGRVSSSKRES